MINSAAIKEEYVIQQVPGNLVSDMAGEKVMLSIKNGKYYNLGETGGEIWELLSKPISIQKLILTLQSQYEIDKSECEQQVTIFLNQLLKEGLVQVEAP
ncbi:lasso peptide biosynthesis PqqD family chaperone [Peribacillus sp. NPDC097197]|uniref:lasso peptide biosynthesis PqqD family chaperone n=1 Tax=Peribacillus sp. NPDC097197 TaxID=3390615 RepID=UPI003CFE8274